MELAASMVGFLESLQGTSIVINLINSYHVFTSNSHLNIWGGKTYHLLKQKTKQNKKVQDLLIIIN